MEAKDLSNNSISRVNKSAMPDFESSGFRSQLLHWYRGKGRQHLPWRLTHDPYHILVSEFMLQQTPVATVLPRYHDWLQRFPDLKSVARGSEHKILLAWQGLGYYSRALNLRATAKIVT